MRGLECQATAGLTFAPADHPSARTQRSSGCTPEIKSSARSSLIQSPFGPTRLSRVRPFRFLEPGTAGSAVSITAPYPVTQARQGAHLKMALSSTE
jgi:hypothetical protein